LDTKGFRFRRSY